MANFSKAFFVSIVSVAGIFLFSEFVTSPKANAKIPKVSVPPTVTIQPGRFSYRLAGEFLKGNRVSDAPLKDIDQSYSLDVMEHLVSAKDYQSCVDAGACAPADNRHLRGRRGLPITGVSYDDAVRYAHWLNQETGLDWRLPSDKEWSYYAADRYYDDAIDIEDDESNPAKRWIAEYKRQSSLRGQSSAMPRLSGAFGKNRFGLYDVSGNVWEWTDTCFQRFHIQDDNSAKGSFENCGVLVAQGKHRAYISSFIQDAKAGGCAVGVPPDNLGFRLVRETTMRSSFKRWINGLKDKLSSSF
ncbi:MAG: formylglycine-generating enzyme family protein [Cohaesibacter sp.]|nr:formylglycine-generating enzyme family protein [Cohaesibacter sp.]